MPEGHVVHRLPRDQRELIGERAVTSPQGRFRHGAAVLDGRELLGVEAQGNTSSIHFEDAAHLHVHLGCKEFSSRPTRWHVSGERYG